MITRVAPLLSVRRGAGATVVRPMADDYGWRLGRLVDPYGHHWEIGKPLKNNGE